MAGLWITIYCIYFIKFYYISMSIQPIKLTEKQKKFYESLKQMIEKSGESPTVAELVNLMKFSSPRAVTQYLESLEKKGLIERRRYEHRGIRLREEGGTGTATINIPVI